MTVVKTVCEKLGIRGSGESTCMTTHGLRATMISMLISGGHCDAAIMLRRGHRDGTNLKSYHNLRGENGREQLNAVFGACESKKENNGQTKESAAFRSRVSHPIAQNESDCATKRPRVGSMDSSSLLAQNLTAANCTFNVTIGRL